MFIYFLKVFYCFFAFRIFGVFLDYCRSGIAALDPVRSGCNIVYCTASCGMVPSYFWVEREGKEAVIRGLRDNSYASQ